MPDKMNNPSKNFFDRKRNEFLASIYTENFEASENIYREILKRIEATEEFCEVDQKAINQVQHIFRTFRDQLTANCSQHMMALFEQLRRAIAKVVRVQVKNPGTVEYDPWRENLGLSEDRFRTMLKTVATLQISVGCSICCRRCNEWALPGPRKHFSFDAATRLIKELFQAGNSEFALYCASDPLDWKCGDKNMVDILGFMSDHGFKPRYGLLTKVPRGSEHAIEKLLRKGEDIGFSITDRNRLKIERIKRTVNKELDVQHDFDDLLIPAGLDEDFESIKSSITDSYGCEITPEGACLVVPTFTSALNLTGQCRLPVTAHTDLFLNKKVGRDALPVEYFKPLELLDSKGQTVRAGGLLEAQIENIMLDNGSEELTPPGMMNMREYFKTYEPDAVKRRKSLLPAVSRGLLNDIVFQGRRKEGWRKKSYAHFRQQVRDYFDTCRMTTVSIYKKNAFSFYLKSIADYLKNHPFEREIILYLRKGDRSTYAEVRRKVLEFDMDYLLEKSNTYTFELFQVLMFLLLDDPEDISIQSFIKANPANGDGFL